MRTLVGHVVARSGLPVLAAGGIRSDADLDALKRAGVEGAIVGRALLEGRIDLARRLDPASSDDRSSPA